MLPISVTTWKSPNVFKSCPKIISQEKWKFLKPLQKLPNNVGHLGKIIVATSFEWSSKVQKIAQSGYTATYLPIELMLPLLTLRIVNSVREDR